MPDTPDTPDALYGDPDAGKPEAEDSDSKPWLDLIVGFDKAGFKDYQDRSDKIDKLYADAHRLASETRDSEFQIFWANIQVLGPSIYSRPPVPVVVPRFRDRKALPRLAAEFLERAVVVTFDAEDIDGVMRMVRDDLTVNARGGAWLRYESGADAGYHGERVCIEWVSRRDFAHDPARTWKEVDWVGKRSWLTKRKMKDRFSDTSGDEYQDAAYKIRKDENDNDDGKLKAGVWEIWCKSANRVVWVSEGCEKVLDSGKPHLDLEGFFPCPPPAYGTLQRGSLVPVSDFVYYQDQISEINSLTNRISALSNALKLKGFYPSGASELGDAIEAAVKAVDDNVVLVGVANWAMLGGGSANKMIVWLPMEMVAATITQLVTLRKELIDDVYQITGLSDIMRGQTDPNETLGAQQIKTQYGSVRVRDRQAALVLFAKDVTRIAAEIMAENFSKKTLLAMTQMEIPSNADIAKQVKELTGRKQQIAALVQRIQGDPQASQQVQQVAQQNPDQAKQIMAKVQQQIQQIDAEIGKLQQQPTIEQVLAFLNDERIRPFVLDIETDSTIAPDENAQKKRATEFITSVGGFLGRVVPLVQATPQLAPLAAELTKYVASQFRAGRELEGAIDEFADQMAQMAGAPNQSPEQAAQETEAQAKQMELQLKQQAAQQDAQMKAEAAHQAQQSAQLDAKMKMESAAHSANLAAQESAAKVAATQQAMAQSAQQHQQTMQKGALDMRGQVLAMRKTGMEMRTAAQQPPGDGQAPAANGGAAMAPMEPIDIPELEFEKNAQAALDGIGQQNAAILHALQQLAAVLAAPKRVVRDRAGEAVGVETVMPGGNGTLTRPVVRDQAGNVVGLQ